MHKENQLLRDFVFPIGIAQRIEGDRYEYESFLGTAFLAGLRGFALTAAHVIKGQPHDKLVGMFVAEDTSWYGFPLTVFDIHPEEDVAIVRLVGGTWTSPVTISDAHVGPGRDYLLAGYPSDTLYELVHQKDERGRPLERPDLIISKGHIRRRVSIDLGIPGVSGSRFFELSSVAGTGCSGSPLFTTLTEQESVVIGLYVGERINDRATSVSYAVRAESFANWSPKVLGRTIKAESLAK